MTNRYAILMAALIVILSGCAHNVVPRLECERYAAITAVYVGPMTWHESDIADSSWGQYYRLVVEISEIYSYVYVELIKTDDEGVTRFVEASYELSPDSLPSYTDVTFPADAFKAEHWLDSNKVRVRVEDSCYNLTLAKEESGLKIEPCK